MVTPQCSDEFFKSKGFTPLHIPALSEIKLVCNTTGCLLFVESNCTQAEFMLKVGSMMDRSLYRALRQNDVFLLEWSDKMILRFKDRKTDKEHDIKTTGEYQDLDSKIKLAKSSNG